LKRYGRKRGKRWSAKLRRSERRRWRLEIAAWVVCGRCRTRRRFIVDHKGPDPFMPRTTHYTGRCDVCGCRRGWHNTNWLILERFAWTDQEVTLNDPNRLVSTDYDTLWIHDPEPSPSS
jgi:hypothetical protein